jgi:hypothetical protein
MDGFIAAYSRKIAGDTTGRPVVHWGRILGALLAVYALAGALLALPRGLPLLLGAATVMLTLETLVVLLWRLRHILPPLPWRLALAAPIVGAAVLAGVSAFLEPAVGFGGRLGVLVALLVLASLAVLFLGRRKVNTPPEVDPGQARHVMRCMRPADRLPVLATLATSFAVCTRWHCSVPGATWPNRTMVHAGTADNTVDNEVRLYTNDTVFDRLGENGRPWRIYRDPDGLAHVMAFSRLWWDDAALRNWYNMADFATHVDADDLPTYSFIEPCHDGVRSNSQHPGNNTPERTGALSDFERGEQLLVSVYETLRAKPDVFAKTVLVITYDEHGGFYDHVPPPTDFTAPAPLGARPRKTTLARILGWFVEQPTSRFEFRLLGPRVPAVVVSPLIPPTCDDTLYDHTTVPATVRKLFAPDGAELSAREARSNTLDHLWSLDRPRTDLPDLSGLRRPPVSPGAAPGPAPPERDDEFARQLRALGELIREELRPPGAVSPDGDVAALFTARAEAARQGD